MASMLNLARNYNYFMHFPIFILFLIFLSCAPKQVPVNFDEINVDEVLQKLKTNNEKLNSLSGIARVKAKSSYDDIVISQVTVLQLPLKFRLEALAAFGQSIAVLTSDGEKVIFRTSDDQVVFPDVRNFNLSNFYPGIPSELKTEQLMDLLIGKIPFGLWTAMYDIGFDEQAQKILVKYKNSNNNNTLLIIDPLSGFIEHAEINMDESNTIEIDYTNFIKIDDLVFPKNIDLKYLTYQLSIKYSEINLNEDIDESLFFQ